MYDRRASQRGARRFWSYHGLEPREYVCPRCLRGRKDVYRFEVHHRDENEKNNDLSNLIAVCRDCHHELHGKRPPETVADWKERGLSLLQ